MFCKSSEGSIKTLYYGLIILLFLSQNERYLGVDSLRDNIIRHRLYKREPLNLWYPHDIEALQTGNCGHYEWSSVNETATKIESRVDEINSNFVEPSLRASKRITHGTHSKLKQFPSHVRLEFSNSNSPEKTLYVLCGGTLVARDQVITAAHCIAAGTNIGHVKAGLVDIGDSKSINTQQAMVKSVCWHKDYVPLEDLIFQRLFAHDFVVLQLDRKLDWTETVQPACLMDGQPEFADKLYTLGMGRINPKETSRNLDSLEVEKVACSHNHELWISCYRSKTIGESCQGDSGSPLIAIKGNRQYLAGVTSVKVTDDLDDELQNCALNGQKPIIYSDIFKERLEVTRMLQYCYEPDDSV